VRRSASPPSWLEELMTGDVAAIMGAVGDHERLWRLLGLVQNRSATYSGL
jgi:hypothetical protein